MPTVLLIDDDRDLLSLLADYLVQDGFTVDRAYDGESGVAAALAGQADIVVLDYMLPAMSGIEALRRIRSTGSRLPILMLTARGDDMDRIIGLEQGADDYVPKPCLPRELAARLRAILRRVSPATPENHDEAIQVGSLVLRPAQRQCDWQGLPLSLTSTEFNLLEVLARHAGKTISKAELSQQALGRPLARFDRSIDVHLSSIRHKLGPLPDGRSCIQTVFRQGYQMIMA